MYYTPPKFFFKLPIIRIHIYKPGRKKYNSKKPADLDLHYFQNRVYPGLALSGLKQQRTKLTCGNHLEIQSQENNVR